MNFVIRNDKNLQKIGFKISNSQKPLRKSFSNF